jgi:hypothetical protein
MLTLSDSRVLILFASVTVILIIAAIVYIVWRIKRSNLQSVDILDNPRRLYNNTSPFTFDSSRLPATNNGQEYSFSMWLYISEFSTTQDNKLIMMRSSKSSTIENASPVVHMDSVTNKVYVSVRTNQSVATTSLSGLLNKQTSGYMTGVIEYIPLQRWVNLTLVVQDSLLTLYMDGDIYTVESLSDFVSVKGRPVFAGLNGDAVIGNIPGTASTKGFISNVRFFNYAISMSDVATIYSRGPTGSKGVLQRMGLPNYGVRSPIYRQGDTSDQ